MPGYIHLILTTNDMPASMKLIKGGSSHRLASTFPVWQRGFTDHRIRDEQNAATSRSYLLNNPVRAGLATSPELYPYSSAYIPTSGCLAKTCQAPSTRRHPLKRTNQATSIPK